MKPEEVRGAQRLAEVLMGDVERIAERSVARMQELLPAYAKVPRDELTPIVRTNTLNLLEAMCRPDDDSASEDAHFRISGATRARQGITSDEMLNAWRIGVEVVREQAHATAEELMLSNDALLQFVVRTLQWGDVGMRASAIAHHEAEIRELGRLVREQAALRRVATLVAAAAPDEEVFAKVAEEVGLLLEVEAAVVWRYEPDGYATVAGIWGALGDEPPVEHRWSLEPDSIKAFVYRTMRSARVDDLGGATGSIAEYSPEIGLRAGVGAPIVVDGRLWGAIVALTTGSGPIATDAEARITAFTELVASAISNVQSRSALEHLAEEQAALRRVATLVAGGLDPDAVFEAVAAEVRALFHACMSAVVRFEPDGVMVMADLGGPNTAGARIPLTPGYVVHSARTTGRVARFDTDDPTALDLPGVVRTMRIRSGIASPILVNGARWGAVTAASTKAPLPADAEARIAQFADLAATAISNVEARTGMKTLADEQAALRRVATLVIEGASSSAVFDAAAAELKQLLNADGVTLSRYEAGDEVTIVAHCGAELRRDLGARASVEAAIVVDGRPWGVAVATWTGGTAPPLDTEERMARFAELLDTAIANADGRDKLTASRARLVTEADDARRRVVRDLHDGAQQRLVHTIITLKLAQRALSAEDGRADALIAEALEHAQQGNAELRELAHGLLPAVLTQGGLRAGVNTIVSRVDLPVAVDIPAQRFPPEIEASAYFVVAEALTNVMKHAHAGRAEVRAVAEDGALRVEVRDDGVAGADPSGHGLVGLADRVTAIGGQLRVESPGTGGTVLSATLPIP